MLMASQRVKTSTESGHKPCLKKEMLDFLTGKVLWDYPLARLSTLKVGGPAKAVVFPENIPQLSQLIRTLQGLDISWRVVGRGSNILVPDQGYPGVIIILGDEFSAIEPASIQGHEHNIRIGAGCNLAKVANWSIEHELSGLDFIYGIPGSIGGAIVMNAGAWGKELCDVLCSIEVMTDAGDHLVIEREKIPYSYRNWGVTENWIVLAGTFTLRKGERKKIEENCHTYQKKRKALQPVGMASAGSFFKNPVGQAAGKLIEDAGLKGCRIGDAQVSPVHANFIVNTGNATATDIFTLMRLVQEKVQAFAGVWLEPEVHILKD